MVVVYQSRGSGKVYTSLQKIKETVENGGKVLCVRKTGQVLIDKNGCTPIPKKRGAK